jgi:hypothetical protein
MEKKLRRFPENLNDLSEKFLSTLFARDQISAALGNSFGDTSMKKSHRRSENSSFPAHFDVNSWTLGIFCVVPSIESLSP